MSRSAVILRNIGANWAGFALNAVVTLFLTPFVLHRLGVARYGVWILSSSIVGYYGLLDLGFRGGVTQYLTRHLAVGDTRRASECLSSGVVAFALLGMVLAVLSVAAAFLAPLWFHFPPGSEHETFWCILIVGCGSSLQFTFFPYTAVFPAVQRFDLANLVGIGTRLLSAVLILGALELDWGLVGISAATFAANTLDYLVRWRLVRHIAPGVQVSVRLARVSHLREVAGFGAWNFLISLNAYVYMYVPPLLIGSVMPMAAVGWYALATGLSRQINSVLSPVSQVMYPAAAAMHVRGDRAGLERLYHDGSRLMLLVTLPLALAAGFWADDFYRLWIGSRYLSGAPFTSVATLLRILLVTTVASYSANLASQVLLGAGHIRVLALALLAGSVLNVGTSAVLVGRLGLPGVAVGTTVAALAVDLIAIPLLVQARLGMRFAGLLRAVCTRPLAAGLLQAALMALIRTVPVGGWASLLLEGALAACGSLAILYAVGLHPAERERFVARPLRQLADRAGWAPRAPLA